MFVVPVAAGLVAARVAVGLLPPARSTWGVVASAALVVAVSWVVVVAAERVARRLSPLAFLLGLALLFPGRAPSRFRVLLRAGSVRRLRHPSPDGRDATPESTAEVILGLMAAVSAHDRHTRGHSERVRAYAEMVGEELGLKDTDLERLRWAALLHDIGKLAVPGDVLRKPATPDDAEWDVLHRHPEEGERLAAPLLPWLGEWGLAIRQHHEHFDGGGYPAGLAGNHIALGARIVAVADAYEAMTAARSYRGGLSPEAARRELVRCAGTQFDPVVVRGFLNLSVARLRRAAGPVAALLELPWLRPLHGVAGQSATTVGAVGVAASVGLAGLAGAGNPGAAAAEGFASPETPAAEVSPPPAGVGGDPRHDRVLTRPATPAMIRGGAVTGTGTGGAGTADPTAEAEAGTAEAEAGTAATEQATTTDGRKTASGTGPRAEATAPPAQPAGESASPTQPQPQESPEDRPGARRDTGPRRTPHPDTPDHAAADPSPDTSPGGGGADPKPRTSPSTDDTGSRPAADDAPEDAPGRGRPDGADRPAAESPDPAPGGDGHPEPRGGGAGRPPRG